LGGCIDDELKGTNLREKIEISDSEVECHWLLHVDHYSILLLGDS
jgi:hypothetical protein